MDTEREPARPAQIRGWLTKRVAQSAMAAITLLLGLIAFPWAADPGLPRGMQVAFHTDVPLSSAGMMMWAFLDQDTPLREGQFAINTYVVTTSLPEAPSAGTVDVLFNDGVSVVECPGCITTDAIRSEVAPAEYRWATTSYTTPISWKPVECGSTGDDGESCYVGETTRVIVEATQPVTVAVGTERARIRIPEITFFGDAPEDVHVSLPLSSRFVVDSGPAPMFAVGVDATTWAGTADSFSRGQIAEASLERYRYREVRIFLAGVLVSIAVSEGAQALYPRWLPDQPAPRSAPLRERPPSKSSRRRKG